MARPVAKGFCDGCQIEFIIWKADKLHLWMKPRPALPEIVSKCPQCGLNISHTISYKDATIFQSKGVRVSHTYDEKDDLQPITEEEITGQDIEELFFKLIEK